MSNYANSNPENWDYMNPVRTKLPKPITRKPIKPHVHICPECGSPDVREVVRQDHARGNRYGGYVTFVDLRCVDCNWVEVDEEGGQ